MFDDDVWRYLPLGPVPSLVLGSVWTGAAIYVAVVRSRTARVLAATMLIASVAIVLAYTARGALSNDNGGFSWRLGTSIRAEMHSVDRPLGLVNIVGNVALFVPIGWLVAVLSPRHQLVMGTFCALLLSTSVECWQQASGSFGDVDDIVLNGVGGFLGACAAGCLRSVGGRFVARGGLAARPR